MIPMPDLDISIIATTTRRPGCGEPGVSVIGAGLANALFNAVGARVRSLPITAEAVNGDEDLTPSGAFESHGRPPVIPDGLPPVFFEQRG